MNLLISFSGTGRIPDQLVILDMKHGVEAKNYEEVRAALTASGGSSVLGCEVYVTLVSPTNYALLRKDVVFSAVM
jgi:hypothetical protein